MALSQSAQSAQSALSELLDAFRARPRKRSSNSPQVAIPAAQVLPLDRGDVRGRTTPPKVIDYSLRSGAHMFHDVARESA